jgi:hypothetical protein
VQGDQYPAATESLLANEQRLSDAEVTLIEVTAVHGVG